MPAPPVVRPAAPADAPTIGRVLAAAFADDPVWSWMASPKADWDARASAWFAAEARAKLAGHGEVLVDDAGRGAALWAPPSRWRSTTAEGLRLAIPSVRLFRERMLQGMRLMQRMERVHPTEPHWYLAILGTDPAHQGTGVGSALIATVTERCDAEGVGAYLESSKESNVAFYARHGFEVRDELTVADGPTMWLMWRDPRG